MEARFFDDIQARIDLYVQHGAPEEDRASLEDDMSKLRKHQTEVAGLMDTVKSTMDLLLEAYVAVDSRYSELVNHRLTRERKTCIYQEISENTRVALSFSLRFKKLMQRVLYSHKCMDQICSRMDRDLKCHGH